MCLQNKYLEEKKVCDFEPKLIVRQNFFFTLHLVQFCVAALPHPVFNIGYNAMQCSLIDQTLIF
jgi:hypothetical protein